MIRVMILDDLKDIRDFFTELINSQPDMEAVCSASCEKESIEMAEKYKPDIILMDIQMDEYNSGIRAAEKINEILPKTKIIMLTIHTSDELIIEAYLAGVVDYLEKTSPPEDICETVRKVYSQTEFLGKIITDAVRKKMQHIKRQETSLLYIINRFSKLTPMENDILKLLYQKNTRKEIAKKKFMSEDTVKTHIRHILRKLGCTSTSEMLVLLEQLGITNYFK